LSVRDIPVTGNTTITQPENRAFFPALDGVRGFAFLLVFCHHYLRMEIGWVGVDIFFVLSGFLITGILFDTRDDPNRARNFYVRRALRIFPLYYLVLLLIAAAAPFVHWQWDWRWLAWPLYLGNWILAVHRGALDPATMDTINGWMKDGQGNVLVLIGHFWSLCVEEQFYLIWPWVVFYVRSRRALIAIASSIVLLWPLLRFVANHTLRPDKLATDLIAHSTVFRLDTLMVGALIALLYRGEARRALFRMATAGIWVAGVITATAIAAFILHPALLHVRAVKPYLVTIGFTIIAAFSAVLIIHCLVPGTVLFRIFTNRVLRWVGRISYGAYIFHDIPHLLYQRLATALHIPTWPLALVCTFALAWLSFRFVETPFLNLKNRFTVTSS
jgi:peptidoglycan/LPS O-acetylase OafA/YrhL